MFNRQATAALHAELSCGLTSTEKKAKLKEKYGGDPKHECDKCGIVFQKPSALQKHFCDTSREDLEKMFKDDDSHWCEKCGQFFVQSTDKPRHVVICQTTKEELREIFKGKPDHWCYPCDIVFAWKQDAAYHTRICGKTKDELRTIFEDNPENWCRKCDTVFTNTSNRNSHVAICGKSEEEIRTLLQDDPSHWCKKCDPHVFFKWTNSAELHILKFHTNINIFNLTKSQMQQVNPLNYNYERNEGTQDPLFPQDENFRNIVGQRLIWANTFSEYLLSRQTDCYVYRVAGLEGVKCQPDTSAKDFIVANFSQFGIYVGINSTITHNTINGWHKKLPHKSTPGQLFIRGGDVFFLSEETFSGPDAFNVARANEALEINYGLIGMEFAQQGDEVTNVINKKRELRSLGLNDNETLSSMLDGAIRGRKLYCINEDCSCPAFRHLLLNKCKKEIFVLQPHHFEQLPPPNPINQQRSTRPLDETGIQTVVKKRLSDLRKEISLLPVLIYNNYSVIVVKLADFPGLTTPRAIVQHLVDNWDKNKIVIWSYFGKGIEGTDETINMHHKNDPSTSSIMSEVEKGVRMAIQISSTRGKSKEDVGEKESFMIYESIQNAKKKKPGVRVACLNRRMEWGGWSRLSPEIQSLAEESGSIGISPFSAAPQDETPLWEEGQFQFPINLNRQLDNHAIKLVKVSVTEIDEDDEEEEEEEFM
ncbi:uncharacterized protein LOC110851636 [Folsomia candida]|uniref:uncharacterized protein LOC110851636 n=1 Tax=Folsomia candida TaxID=158441 RepID=UPI000B8F8756|nr:uncharacterized protein LOC110851636 [Folsomia candida]